MLSKAGALAASRLSRSGTRLSASANSMPVPATSSASHRAGFPRPFRYAASSAPQLQACNCTALTKTCSLNAMGSALELDAKLETGNSWLETFTA
eukprot:6037973-Pleurochrysis_carterae.AAC.1